MWVFSKNGPAKTYPEHMNTILVWVRSRERLSEGTGQKSQPIGNPTTSFQRSSSQRFTTNRKKQRNLIDAIQWWHHLNAAIPKLRADPEEPTRTTRRPFRAVGRVHEEEGAKKKRTMVPLQARRMQRGLRERERELQLRINLPREGDSRRRDSAKMEEGRVEDSREDTPTNKRPEMVSGAPGKTYFLSGVLELSRT